MTRQEQFAAKVQELLARSRALPPEVSKSVLELLDEARKRILGELAGMNPQSYSAVQLTHLKQSIDTAMDQFRAKTTQRVQQFEQQSWTLGSQMAQQPIVTAGFSAFGQVDAKTLAIAEGYTADLITGLSKDAAAKINATIQRAFLGGQTMDQIIAAIGRSLNGGKAAGTVFSAIGARAEAIAINEIGRVQSMATQARLEDAAASVPDVQKQWHRTMLGLRPRLLHILADQQVQDVDKPFDVGGEQLMYPRDPNGSAENTINCHCYVAPFFSADALKPTAGQKGLLESLGISVRAA